MDLKYRSIFISDLHLGLSSWQAEVLNHWLKENPSEYLYLVGDIIDMWKLKRSWFWPEYYNVIIRRFIQLAAHGTKTFYIPGNHDEMFKDLEGLHFGGIEIKNECIHITADNKKCLVVHGDQFDLIVLEKKFITHIGAIGYEILFAINNYISSIRRFLRFKKHWSLSQYMKTRVKDAVKFIGRFEEAAISYAKQKHMDAIILGHIHNPDMKVIDNIGYINIGDFLENMTLLVEHLNGTFEIVHFPNVPSLK